VSHGDRKRCSTCGEEKPLDQFNRLTRSKDGRQYNCRACNAAYHYENWDRHMDQIRSRKKRMIADAQRRLLEYLSTHPCVDCGQSDVEVLEFDHQRDKTHNVSYLVRSGHSWSRIAEEIDKCEVRCANCHRRRTARQQGSYRVRDAGVGRPGLEPGTTTA
jgi:hypothetical protein